MAKRTHYRCRCGKRYAAFALDTTTYICPCCNAVGSYRIDRWANGRMWRKWTCSSVCQYGWPHHRGSEFCDFNRDGSYKTHEQLYGEPSAYDIEAEQLNVQPHPADEYF